MFAKKPPVALPRTYKSELEYLYARRMAIDALIESLEDYDRSRSKRLEVRKRKTA
jgi:hypothetical protein